MARNMDEFGIVTSDNIRKVIQYFEATHKSEQNKFCSVTNQEK
jgi:hypothetical protein